MTRMKYIIIIFLLFQSALFSATDSLKNIDLRFFEPGQCAWWDKVKNDDRNDEFMVKHDYPTIIEDKVDLKQMKGKNIYEVIEFIKNKYSILNAYLGITVEKNKVIITGVYFSFKYEGKNKLFIVFCLNNSDFIYTYDKKLIPGRKPSKNKKLLIKYLDKVILKRNYKITQLLATSLGDPQPVPENMIKKDIKE